MPEVRCVQADTRPPEATSGGSIACSSVGPAAANIKIWNCRGDGVVVAQLVRTTAAPSKQALTDQTVEEVVRIATTLTVPN